jgi:hypothetical protein
MLETLMEICAAIMLLCATVGVVAFTFFVLSNARL